MRRRILFVAMQSSVHVARWIRQLEGLNWDLHLFPVNSALPHDELAGVTIHWPLTPLRPRAFARTLRRNRVPPTGTAPTANGGPTPRLVSASMLPIPSLALPASVTKYLRPRPRIVPSSFDMFTAAMLTRLVRWLKPDLVHSMEFQHAGYLALRAKERSPDFAPWLATNWGSDLYHYRHLPEHRAMIQRLLSSIDFYSCECERDIEIARSLNLRAPALPVMPNSGGFNIEQLAALSSGLAPSQRRLVMVKGYQHFVGRAMTALDAIEHCADLLEGREVLVFSASTDVETRVAGMARAGRIAIRTLPPTAHQEMLRLFGRARVYLGVSNGDAIGTSLLEAMAMGAFPIQTNTSCCDEWIEDRRSGFSIPPDDLPSIVERLRTALVDDTLVDGAAALNAVTVRTRLDERILRVRAQALYDQAFDTIEHSRLRA
jgi:hypothetical protein